MPKIFISYRRDDAKAWAGRMYDYLRHSFGKDVIMDVRMIEPGEIVVEILEKKLWACDVLIAVIGKDWLNATDQQGRRRLAEPRDLVRMEIATGLQRRIRVIPALVDGSVMPRADELPEDLAPLAGRNAIEISHARFDEDMAPLLNFLQKMTPAQPASKTSLIAAAETLHKAAELFRTAGIPGTTQPPCIAYSGLEPYIFVSYAHADKEIVYPEITMLHQRGYRIWYDEGITPASNWTEQIAAALKNCHLFLVFMTPRAAESRYVRDEIYFALHERKPYLLVYLERTLLPKGLKFVVGGVQAIMKYDLSDETYLRRIQTALPEQAVKRFPDR